MCPDRRAVDHLNGLAAAAIGQSLKDQVRQTANRPPPVLPVHGIPTSERLRQIAPGRAGPGNPEDRIKRAPMVLGRTPAQWASFNDKRLKERPLRIRYQTSGQN
jgi:hypothetical protein